MEQEVNLFIETITDHNFGFGVTVPDGVTVYIPRGVVVASGIAEGNTVTAQVVPNHYRPEKCPLMAIRVTIGQAHEEVELPSIEDDGVDVQRDEAANAALKLVKEDAEPWTLRDLMDEIFGATGWSRATHHRYMVAISNKLNHAHRRGEVARAQVWQRGDQQKPSRVVWASDWRELF